jgi:hypothetical protein
MPGSNANPAPDGADPMPRQGEGQTRWRTTRVEAALNVYPGLFEHERVRLRVARVRPGHRARRPFAGRVLPAFAERRAVTAPR